MKLSHQQQKGSKFLQQVFIKAWADDGFKNKLIEDPVKTLENFFGKKISGYKKIVFTDQSDPSCIYINLPVEPNKIELELMKRELKDFLKTHKY